MPDKVPEKQVKRYLSIKALAERGSPGERDNARRALRRMEKRFPSIKTEALRFLRKKKAEQDREEGSTGGWSWSTTDGWGSQPRGGAPPPPRPAGGPAGAGNWENIFSWAQSVAQGVYGFAQTVGNVVAGRQLAEHVRSSVRVSRANNLLLTLKMSMEIYEMATELNPLQLQAFRDALHEKLDEELDGLFGEAPED